MNTPVQSENCKTRNRDVRWCELIHGLSVISVPQKPVRTTEKENGTVTRYTKKSLPTIQKHKIPQNYQFRRRYSPLTNSEHG